MGQSWSQMRKQLEEEFICDALKGRIQYFATRYRNSHDNEGRVAIRLDGTEIFQSNFFDWDRKRDIVRKSGSLPDRNGLSYYEFWNKVHLETKKLGGFDQFGFYDAFYEYRNQSIENSLRSEDPVVNLFAIFDKRVGKRRLEQIAKTLETQPPWLQALYRIRLDAEGIRIK